MANIYFYDDVNVSLIPTNAQAIAYYVNGNYANFTAAKQRVPNAKFVGITVTASYTGSDARVLDVESGDATNAQAVTWAKTKIAQGVKPVIYSSASNMQTLINLMAADGVQPNAYWRWSAHYTNKAHICSNKTGGCGYPVSDATQFTDVAGGKSLDESEGSAAFMSAVFGTAPAPAPSVPGVPTNGTTTVTATSATIHFTGVATAVKYRVQVYAGDALTGKLVHDAYANDGTAGKDGVTVTGLTANTKYGWRVVGTNGSGASGAWSGLIGFTTAANPGAFAAPSGLAMSAWITRSFSWKAVPAVSGKAPTGYTVQVLDNQGKQFNEQVVTGTSATVALAAGKYSVLVWANGGPSAPPHASISITV